MTPPPIRYVHVLEFSAIHQLRDPRTNVAEHDLHGHWYTVELGFEDASPAGLGLPERDTTQEAVTIIGDFVRNNLHNADLTRMGFRTTPLGIAWYLFERISEHPDAGRDLTDITIILDGAHRHTYRPLPAERA